MKWVMAYTKMIGAVGLGAWFLVFTATGVVQAAEMGFEATAPSTRLVYHSPQTPGYTCWTGCWLMPDGTLMTSFH